MKLFETATNSRFLRTFPAVEIKMPAKKTEDSRPKFEDRKSEDFCELTFEPLDVGAIARRVVFETCGATVTLDGYVRRFTGTRETLYLEYEGYEPMAIREMEKLIEQARGQFEIALVGIVHRLGKLAVGETSVVISVAAPHRRHAFEACEWLIKELKRTVPIWKKEVYADGEVWVEGENARAKS